MLNDPQDHCGCDIIPVGKRRDGGTRYWCLKHRADATAKYGRPAKQCLRAHIAEPTPAEIVTIDTTMYPGGLGLWGAVPPIYDTTNREMDRGIHVHARKTHGGEKVIDQTYRHVDLVHDGNRYPIDELDAIYFMVSTVFGFPVKSVLCEKCGYSHLDKDWFSVHPHQVHLCAGCGRKFRDGERAIGNPVGVVRDVTGMVPPPCRSANRKIKINQKDFAGGIQIWGSNPAILWSSDKTPESGIHVHAFESDADLLPVIDDTYSSVIIDGYKLNAEQVRRYMAQSAMPHIVDRVMALQCKCGADLFDQGENAYTPALEHRCDKCGQSVRSSARLRKVIANPILRTLDRLSDTAVRGVRQHDMQLLPEAP